MTLRCYEDVTEGCLSQLGSVWGLGGLCVGTCLRMHMSSPFQYRATLLETLKPFACLVGRIEEMRLALLVPLQVPFGMKSGAPVSVGLYISRNMIPVAIGNTISGMHHLERAKPL